MKVVKSCKRGNMAERDRFGHCLCSDCRAYRYQKQLESPSRAESQKKWREENRVKVRGYVKKWIDNNKEQRREIVKSWQKRNPEKVKEKNAKAGKKWAANNKGKRNAIDMKRKAGLIKRTPKWANLELIRLVYEEAARITKETGIPHEVDHIIPLQGVLVSGLHVHNNLQILTRSQNRSKANKITDLCVR